MKMFRIILQVADLDAGLTFYSKLLDAAGRKVGGGRVYFDCGSMILALLEDPKPAPMPESVYFAVADVEAGFGRAKALECLSTEDVHGESAGAIVKRPWGERSFYAVDPWGNGLCFVDEKTVFTGERRG